MTTTTRKDSTPRRRIRVGTKRVTQTYKATALCGGCVEGGRLFAHLYRRSKHATSPRKNCTGLWNWNSRADLMREANLTRKEYDKARDAVLDRSLVWWEQGSGKGKRAIWTKVDPAARDFMDAPMTKTQVRENAAAFVPAEPDKRTVKPPVGTYRGTYRRTYTGTYPIPFNPPFPSSPLKENNQTAFQAGEGKGRNLIESGEADGSRLRRMEISCQHDHDHAVIRHRCRPAPVLIASPASTMSTSPGNDNGQRAQRAPAIPTTNDTLLAQVTSAVNPSRTRTHRADRRSAMLELMPRLPGPHPRGFCHPVDGWKKMGLAKTWHECTAEVAVRLYRGYVDGVKRYQRKNPLAPLPAPLDASPEDVAQDQERQRHQDWHRWDNDTHGTNVLEVFDLRKAHHARTGHWLPWSVWEYNSGVGWTMVERGETEDFPSDVQPMTERESRRYIYVVAAGENENAA